MSLATFGVARLLRYVMMNKKIKSKREVFMFLDILLQASLVGNILWLVMIITKEVIFKNYIILLIASIISGIFSSFVDTNKIFGKGSKVTLTKPQANDKQWLIFYLLFVLLYFALDIFFGFKLLG